MIGRSIQTFDEYHSFHFNISGLNRQMGMAMNESTTMIFEFFLNLTWKQIFQCCAVHFPFEKTIERNFCHKWPQEEADEGAEDSEEEDYQLQQVRIPGKTWCGFGEELEVLPHSPLESLMENSLWGTFVDESEVRRSAVGRVFQHDRTECSMKLTTIWTNHLLYYMVCSYQWKDYRILNQCIGSNPTHLVF